MSVPARLRAHEDPARDESPLAKPDGDPPPARRIGRDAWVLLPAIAAYAVLAAAMSEFVTDDALITLRYARQWAAGNGLRWNAGEDPVEGFTNFSHVALGALSLRAGILPLTFLRAVNVLASLGLVVLTYALARRTLWSQPWAAAAALLVGAHPALAYWSVSGLETSAYACALLLGVWAVEARGYALAFAGFFVAALTRVEGVAVTFTVIAVQVGAALLRRRPAELRAQLSWMLPWLLAYGLYFAWRYDYFGYPLSNSAYFKGRSNDGPTLLVDFAVQNAALLALVPFAPFRRLGTLGISLFAMLALYVVGYYGVAQSVSYLHRFFLPVYPAAVLLAIAALDRLWRASWSPRLSRRLALAGFCCVLAWDLLNTAGGVGAALHEVSGKGSRTAARARVASFIAAHYPPHARVAMQDIGVVGYVLLNPILDTFGLNSEAYTHRFAKRRGAYLAELLATQPDIVVLASKHRRRLQPIYGTDRHIAANGAFRDYRLTHAVGSRSERYHYLIYARPGLQALPQRRGAVRVDERGSPARMIETLAEKLWIAQLATKRGP